jgi:hypothetical protein
MDYERRNRQRVTVHFDVGIILGEEIIKVQILNISLTGILCTSHPLFKKDAPCKVKISLSQNQQTTINSKIIRVGEQGTAVSFVEMDEQSFVQLMWCSTHTVTRAASEEISGNKPSNTHATATTGHLPSNDDKSLMLKAFGMPPDKFP